MCLCSFLSIVFVDEGCGSTCRAELRASNRGIPTALGQAQTAPIVDQEALWSRTGVEHTLIKLQLSFVLLSIYVRT